MTRTTTPNPSHVVARNAAKSPKAKIQKAHKLAAELLALWQRDIRPWYRDNVASEYGEETELIDFRVLNALNTFREMRIEVEDNNVPDATVRAGAKLDS